MQIEWIHVFLCSLSPSLDEALGLSLDIRMAVYISLKICRFTALLEIQPEFEGYI